MLGYTLTTVTVMLGVFMFSLSVMVFMLIVAAGQQDKQDRLQQLLKHPLIGDIVQQAPNEITVLFYRAIDDNSNIDSYMLEYLESYIHKAK
jgi:hypothetical protein